MSKVILITGVSSGFGKYTAELLAQQGHIVYGTSRNELQVNKNIRLINMDVTNMQSVENAVNIVIEKEGKIDVLINNAGMGLGGPIEAFTEEEAYLQMNSNFMGTYRLCKAVLPVMRKRKNGLIINISSIGGLMGLPFQGFYSASKFAVEGFSEALRFETKQFNIKVVLVNPGDFNTHFTANRKTIKNSENYTDYTQSFNQTIKIIENDENNGLPPTFLARKISKIIDTSNPSTRYIIASFEQKLAVFLKYLLPEKWFFSIIGSHYKIEFSRLLN
jgi:short-subunit dehydrogenase